MRAGLDETLMARAQRLAERGLYSTDPNPRVGCVIAHGDRIVGEGYHTAAGGPHAEVVALDAAGARARAATAYITLEPCCHHGRTPPCTEALIAAGIERVVCAMRDPDPRVSGQGLRELERAGIRVDRLDRSAGDARALNVGFIKRMTTGRPWVRVKLATSLDGRTALADGESRWITGTAARADVHRWRARASCILTGRGTVAADNPRLDVRLDAGDQLEDHPVPAPAVAILDSTLRTPPDARVFDLHAGVLVFGSRPDPEAAERLRRRGAEPVIVAADEEGRPSLRLVLEELGRRQVNELHVEAGAELCGGLLRAGCVDELVWYMAPHLLGTGARGAFSVPDLSSMDERTRLLIRDVRHVGSDLCIRALPVVDRDHERRK